VALDDALHELAVPLGFEPVPVQADEQVELGHETTEVASVLLVEYVVAAKIAQIGLPRCDGVGEDPHRIRSDAIGLLIRLDKERPIDLLVDVAAHGEDVIYV